MPKNPPLRILSGSKLTDASIYFSLQPSLEALAKQAAIHKTQHHGSSTACVWISHAWPANEYAYPRHLKRLLLLITLLQTAGITVYTDLTLAQYPTLIPANIAGIHKTLDSLRELGCKVLLLGSPTYKAHAADASRLTSIEVAYFREMQTKDRRSVIPILWDYNDFQRAFPHGFTETLGYKLNTIENLFRQLPGLLGHLLTLEEYTHWLTAIKEYKENLTYINECCQITLFDKDLVHKLSKSSHEATISANRELEEALKCLPKDWRLMVDTHLRSRQENINRRLSFWATNLAINKQETPLYQAADTWHKERPLTVNIQGEEKNLALVMTEWLKDISTDPGKVVLLTGKNDIRKRDALRWLEQHAWQKWRKDHNEPMPVFIQLRDPMSTRNNLLEHTLRQWGMLSHDIAFLQQYQRILILVDIEGAVNFTKNFYMHCGWSQWQLSCVIRCQQSTLINTVDHLTPYNADGEPEQDRFTRWEATAVENIRRGSLTFDQTRYTPRPIIAENLEQHLRLPSPIPPTVQPPQEHSSRYQDEAKARCCLQNRHHSKAFNALAQALLTLPNPHIRTKDNDRYDIFISYAHPEYEPMASNLQLFLEKLVEDLEKIGMKVLWDRAMRVGDDITAFINKIDQSNLVFVIDTSILAKRVLSADVSNVKSEFDKAYSRQEKCSTNSPAVVYRILHGCNTAEHNLISRLETIIKHPTVYDNPRDPLPKLSIIKNMPLFDLRITSHYYKEVPLLWLQILGLTAHTKALQLMQEYNSTYEKIENTQVTPAITATIETAITDREKAKFAYYARILSAYDKRIGAASVVVTTQKTVPEKLPQQGAGSTTSKYPGAQGFWRSAPPTENDPTTIPKKLCFYIPPLGHR